MTVLVHQDVNTPLVTINMLYKVGARDESPSRTGFAHLFEHLMFGGSKHAPSYDEVVQLAGGDSNAYTNADLTNFYTTLPAINIETALWLEADRMQHLTINQKTLSTQQHVVIEEFKETCINQPYGLVWHQLAGLSYLEHPYRWPTIGLDISHIADANLEEVKDFYSRFYGPNNAILAIGGPEEPAKVLELVKKYFDKIPARSFDRPYRPEEKPATDPRLLEDNGNYPSSVVYFAWLMDGRNGEDYYSYDLLSDVMSLGRSAVFYQRMVKMLQVCSHIDAYITGTEDSGLFILELRPAPGVDLARMEEALWNELTVLQQNEVTENVLQKLKNKNESTVCFANTSCAQITTNLAYYESLGDASMMNEEPERVAQVTSGDILRVANKLSKTNAITLRLISQKPVAAGIDEEGDDEEESSWD